eukprot:CAMPEP_0185775314 /NCGR_PEP_ID=MMETSP1174-20130828/81615_1 /TAXON_ID=35687 /ORGANISM="Dictyocha speculum, Strain CCMP1381" /LENGTH=63 /DNA_ID=CAMNT_0028462845 /DNA_START=78 /DNA_END=265 /DNA_ORIENTATION=-
MSNYHQRHVALLLYYEGGAYAGFASQTLDAGRGEEHTNTVERHVFGALQKTCLVAEPVQSAAT